MWMGEKNTAAMNSLKIRNAKKVIRKVKVINHCLS